MPSNLAPAVVFPLTRVLPLSLCTSFTETQSFPMLNQSYHDGTVERGLIQDGVNPPRPARVWVLAKRLTTSQLSTLLTFWETTVQGGLYPFYFYDPYDVTGGAKVGSNWDGTGVSTQGRVKAHFRGDWGQRTMLGRHEVSSIMLVEPHLQPF